MIRIFTGRAGAGKTKQILDEILLALAADRFGPPIFLLVPDQVTFYMERELAKRVPGQSLVRAQVMSFRRFSLRGLQLIGQLPAQMVSKNGKFLLMAAAYDEVSEQLQVFRRANPSAQFIERLLLTVEEFQTANLTGIPLEPQIATLKEDRQLHEKVHDLAILLQAYERALQDRFIDPLHLLPLFARELHRIGSLRSAQIYVDGFLGFTAQEFSLLGALFEHVENMSVSLTLPLERANELARTGFARVDELDSPFAQADDTFLHLRKLADQKQRTLHIVNTQGNKLWRFTASPRLNHLEKAIFTLPEESEAPFYTSAERGDLVIAKATTRRAEVLGTIREMLRIHREEQVPWREFTLMVTNLDLYRPLLREVLQQAKIPFFMDELHSMRHHPVARFILHALSIIESQLSSQAIIEWLKTDLTPIPRFAVDQLENFVLLNGIEGEEWLISFELTNYKEFKSEIEAVRSRVASWLLPFYQVFQSTDSTVRQMITALWNLLESCDVPGQISALIEREEASDNTFDAQAHERALVHAITLCDDLVYAFGERKLPVARVLALLRQAFGSSRIGVIPMLLDQIIITEVSRVRAYEVQYGFLIGCNDGLFPRRIENDEMFSDEERKQLITKGFSINPESSRQQVYERYRVYMAMTRAQKKLVLSYALADENGRALAMATILQQMISRFAPEQMIEYNYIDQPQWNDEEDVQLCMTEESMAQHLTTILREVKKGERLTPLWHGVFQLFASGKLNQEVVKSKLQGLAYVIDSEPLAPEIAQKLFHNAEVLSVSRLEQFAACPFAHFAKYGLRLKRREEFQIDELIRGQLVHEVLHQFVVWIKKEGVDWGSLDSHQAFQILNQVFASVLTADNRIVWRHNARFRNQLEQVRQALLRAIDTLTEHAHRSSFQVYLTEAEFEFALPGDLPLRLRGRIDRLDTSAGDRYPYFRIIDYKSSERSLNLEQVYYGLSLQLILYAEVVEQQSIEWFGHPHKFAGVFYYPIRDLVKQVDAPTPIREVERTKRKALQMKGLILREPKLVSLLDRKNAVADDLFPVLLKKDGQFKRSVQTVDDKEWEALKHHAKHLAVSFMNRVRKGDTAIAPYRYKKNTACQHCSFQGICQFEESGGLGSYHQLPKINGKEILQKLCIDKKKG
ncbi:PD-(D/E)XK nuclease family protein [Sulfoacidibacillus thermotolerans]|uniref:Uncharacterized protein n=1 Tax=Sulfoacidibacillus thermotolerans TaxID=1765684 RepID=A0A2U3DBV2_SULT2|nr:PD-(D/E)XK nuclease family protein [Sulfoacidibacillus thermotolerans]PWI58753.1 hypothetical protein BM613_01260 [Sulfoacidibacillus thermotolerans]